MMRETHAVRTDYTTRKLGAGNQAANPIMLHRCIPIYALNEKIKERLEANNIHHVIIF
jgi:hypothetical protein